MKATRNCDEGYGPRNDGIGGLVDGRASPFAFLPFGRIDKRFLLAQAMDSWDRGRSSPTVHLAMPLLVDGDKAIGREQLPAALELGLSRDDGQQARDALARSV